MASKTQTKKGSTNQLESTDEMEMLLRIIKTGECIGGLELGGKHYQLWDYKTSLQCKLPGDMLVGIWVDHGAYSILWSSLICPLYVRPAQNRPEMACFLGFSAVMAACIRPLLS